MSNLPIINTIAPWLNKRAWSCVMTSVACDWNFDQAIDVLHKEGYSMSYNQYVAMQDLFNMTLSVEVDDKQININKEMLNSLGHHTHHQDRVPSGAKLIQEIKEYRNLHSCGLKEARTAILRAYDKDAILDIVERLELAEDPADMCSEVKQLAQIVSRLI